MTLIITVRKFFSKPTLHSVLLYIFVVFCQITVGIYQTSHIDEPPLFYLVYRFGLPCFLGWWLLQDSRRRGVPWIFDLGMFLYIAWPVILPYHLFKTRRLRGALVIGGFVAVYIVAFVVGVGISFLINPAARLD